MPTTPQTFDPKLLHDGLMLIEGMSITAFAGGRNTSLSKTNREFFRRKQDALQQVMRCAAVGAAVMGALHG